MFLTVYIRFSYSSSYLSASATCEPASFVSTNNHALLYFLPISAIMFGKTKGGILFDRYLATNLNGSCVTSIIDITEKSLASPRATSTHAT